MTANTDVRKSLARSLLYGNSTVWKTIRNWQRVPSIELDAAYLFGNMPMVLASWITYADISNDFQRKLDFPMGVAFHCIDSHAQWPNSWRNLLAAHFGIQSRSLDQELFGSTDVLVVEGISTGSTPAQIIHAANLMQRMHQAGGKIMLVCGPGEQIPTECLKLSFTGIPYSGYNCFVGEPADLTMQRWAPSRIYIYGTKPLRYTAIAIGAADNLAKYGIPSSIAQYSAQVVLDVASSAGVWTYTNFAELCGAYLLPGYDASGQSVTIPYQGKVLISPIYHRK